MGSVSKQQFTTEELQLLYNAAVRKWFKVRIGFSFLSLTACPHLGCAWRTYSPPVEGFQSLKEGEAVEFTYKKCYKCGGLDHHAKDSSHRVASSPLMAQQIPSSQGKAAYFGEEKEEEIHRPALLPQAQN
ncbi:unnamed protein product [Nyctereutes procyonoides]|uniref:(raccoon dog) hypothetical protein n=1 Tax=Nyctereutes procyonoides TaxID=34880 RepID=A0A811Z358_NYCPR|nr:unnamed protein product [Nyctereutes procyonoides]